MAPEIKPARVTRPNVVRANPVQTEILKNAYALSNVTTPEQLKALSQATNLPEKWIHQWFGRQRMKDRKLKPKAASSIPDSVIDYTGPSDSTSLSTGSTPVTDFLTSYSVSSVSSASLLDSSNLDTILSHQEIIQVKQEHHDSVPDSFLPKMIPIPISATASLSEMRDPSETLTGTSMLSLGYAERPPSVSVGTMSLCRPKKKGRKPQDRERDQIKNRKGYGAETTPAMQRKTRRRRGTHVKAECVETSTLQESVVDGARGPSMAINQGTGRNTRAATQSSVTDYTQLLPMIGPPRRSSLSHAGNIKGAGSLAPQTARPFTSSAGNICAPSQNAYTAGSIRDVNASTGSTLLTQDPEHISVTEQTGYPGGQESVFRTTQFHNQGPWNYAPSPMLVSSNPATNAAGSKGKVRTELASEMTVPALHYPDELPVSNFLAPRLGPAFDWENHIPLPVPEVLISSLARNEINQHQEPEILQVEAVSEIGHEYLVEREETMSVNQARETQSGPVLRSSAELPGFETLTGTVLDPLLAPLKHLTDVLELFKDEEGTYMPLMQEDRREVLVECLLDERIVEQNPFQAAMGLSLLSKLGVEWEM